MFAVLPYPAIDPAIFTLPGFDAFGWHLGPFALRWYALAYMAGLLLAWRYIGVLLKNSKLWRGQPAPMAPDSADDFLFWATLGVIFGGRLGYVLFYKPDMLWKAPADILAVWNGGMSFHGGLIGVLLAIVYFARSRNVPIVRLGDLAAAAAPFGLFFGRIANFINGELWGRPTNLPWAMVFPEGGALPRHPSQLYEAALEGLVMFVLLRVATHRFLALTRPGLVAGLFLTFYAFSRISLETVRQPDAHLPDFPLGLTMGMLLSLPMLAGGLWLVLQARKDLPAPLAPPAAAAPSPN